jgi:hypothetical protein
MKYALITLVLIAVLPTPSFARWASIPLIDLVQDSDVIIVGTLSDVREYSEKGMDYGNGTIQVEEVIWGNITKGQNLALLWSNRTDVVCPRIEHRGHENQKGIWLLTIDEQGNVAANYPRRFVDLTERDQVIDALVKRPVRLRVSKFAILPNEPIEISLIFRNPTKRRQSYSGLQYRNGFLYLNSRTKLELIRGWGEDGEKIAPLANKTIVSEELAPIFVEPGQEYIVTFNVKDFFDFSTDPSSKGTQEDSYVFKISAKEFAKLNEVHFYQKAGNKEQQSSGSLNKPGRDVGAFYHNRYQLIAELGLCVVALSVVLFSYRFKSLKK